MAKKKIIRVQLSEKSINDAIREIQAYKNSLDEKVRLFVEKLADIGINSIHATMTEVDPVYSSAPYTVIPVYDKKGIAVHGARIQLSGSQVLFIEFSAGITYGTNSFKALPNNPNYGQGMGMGTYPDGKGHWDDPKGWWFINDNGESVHTFGTRAYAPMYHADRVMRIQIGMIAKEVFG